jgi:diguanylate cyclase (GGDEF)-like protein/PAS domain S-box-containing protein
MRLISWLRHLFGRAPAAPRGDARADAFRILADNSADVIFQFGMDLKARYISPSAEQLFGLTPAEIKALNGTAGTTELIYAEDKPTAAAALKRHIAGEFEEMKMDFRIVHKDGRLIWVESNCRLVRDPATAAPTDLVLTLRDISLKKQIEAELAELARTDGLTGIANRRAFDDELEREWRRAVRDKAQMSLLMVDVDHFKSFNDHNGHQVGDDCLRAVANALVDAVRRPGDLVARYGGEEFALILPGTGQEGALQLAAAALAAIEGLHLPHPGNETCAWVTASIGVATAVATSGGTIRMPEGLLQAADMALYKAKAGGRNRVETALVLSAAEAGRTASG